MWVRMGSFAVKVGAELALRTAYNGLAVPRVRAQAGNVGCLLLEPVSPGEPHVVLTMWTDRAAAEAYEASGAAAEVVALVKEHFAGPPKLHTFSSASEGGWPPIGA